MRSIKKIAVLVNRNKREYQKIIARLDVVLRGKAITRRIIDRHITDTEEISSVSRELASYDLLITIGGDGTLLNGLTLIVPHTIPVLPVYHGTLGFIAEIDVEQSAAILAEMVAGKRTLYEIEKRHLIDVELASGREVTHHTAVNEAVVAKGNYPKLGHFAVDINGKNLAYVKADGIIVASPTGSTAYALSAGGPIINPRVNALILLPIAPHSLTFRPLVVCGDDTIAVSLAAESGDTALAIDGRPVSRFRQGDSVRVTVSQASFRLVKLRTRSFYEVLKEKLHWGK
ncbi:MAG: NAD(+)/NADH kinase [Spirochaetes bacterium]|nr:NAD(+)/NADH kinase [Spirochaetota bacterium]